MLKLDSNGEGSRELKSISALTLWRTRELAKEKEMYLYIFGNAKSVASGTESTLVLVLRKEPPAYRSFLDYVILHDPTSKPQSMRCFAREWRCCGPDLDLPCADIDETLFAKCC